MLNWPSSMSRRSIRVGIDVVDVRQLAASIATFGDRFLHRVFTEHELATTAEGDAAVRAHRLAARFAAKEATLKVLRPDRHWVDWRTIEVRRFEAGHCEIALRGEATALAARAGIHRLHVSLTHEADIAAAIVLGEGNERAPVGRLRIAQHGNERQRIPSRCRKWRTRFGRS